MGTSEGARARYTSEASSEILEIVADLKIRGMGLPSISQQAGLYLATLPRILEKIRKDEECLVSPETLQKLRDLHARILADDSPERARRIQARLSHLAHARRLQERRKGITL